MTPPQFEPLKNSEQLIEVATVQGQNQLTVQQQADLNDPETQARYISEFNEQMRRLSCPGCGDS